MIFFFGRVENIVGKGENAGYQQFLPLKKPCKNIVGKEENAGYKHFLLFPQCFQKAFYSGSLKVGIIW